MINMKEEQMVLEGAVHWKSTGPKLQKAFQQAGGQQFSDSDWLQSISKGSNETRFQSHCTFVLFKDTLVGT